MQLRKMRIEDYDGVFALWKSCAGMGLNSLDDSKEGIGQFLKRNPDTCFVALDADKIIGAIMCGNDGRRGYIYHTAVQPDQRMRGIGSELVERALTALKDAGINKVALVVFDRNQAGNEFWEKKGFTVRDDLIYRNKALTEMIRMDT